MSAGDKTQIETASNATHPKKEKSQTVFLIGVFILAIICVPYIYYAMWINSYGNEHAPAGFKFTAYTDLWKTLVGGTVC